jgi:beta-N-acetylhexosaminidase
MSEHIAIPSVTQGSVLPASVEKKLATGWLRDKLGFKGILTTDDVWYDHVIERFGPVEIAIRVVQAGHDIILKPKDPIATIEGLVAAVKSGKIAETRIDRSVRKLLYQKALLNLHKNRYVDEERVNTVVGIPAHLEVAQKIADLSLTLLKNEGVLPIGDDKRDKVVNISFQKNESDPSPAALAGKLAAAFPGMQNFVLRPDGNPEVHRGIRSVAVGADLVILSFFVQRNRAGDPAPIREDDLTLIKKIIAAKPKSVIAMSYGNPHLIRKIEEVPVFIVGYGEGGWYGNQTIYFDSFIKLLQGKLKPSGMLPIKVSDKFPIGTGLSY